MEMQDWVYQYIWIAEIEKFPMSVYPHIAMEIMAQDAGVPPGEEFMYIELTIYTPGGGNLVRIKPHTLH
jgi:hypothetical protein